MDIKQQVSKIQESAISDPRFKHSDEVVVTKEVADYIDMIFNSMLPHFPGWRHSYPTNDDLGALKNAWAKAIIRQSRKSGKKLNLKAGLIACEESESDWLPSVGKFIKWCDQDDGLTEFAERAYRIFSNPKWKERQTCNIGQMVVSGHDFELRNMKAADGKKRFIELYLEFAADNEIKQLDEFALPETVQLSPEQQKEADKRKQTAQNSFLDKFSGLLADKPKEKPVKPVETGVTTGKIKAKEYKSQRQLEIERDRQLKAAGLK